MLYCLIVLLSLQGHQSQLKFTKVLHFSYKAMKQVKELIANEPCYPVPLHLRNAVTLLDSEMDYGKGYKYNPDYVTNVQQEYLPANLRLKHYFDFKPVKL